MENVLESDDGWTPERYAAALRGAEYALVKSEGVVELGELYPMNGKNRTNGEICLVDAPTVPAQSIDVRVVELAGR